MIEYLIKTSVKKNVLDDSEIGAEIKSHLKERSIGNVFVEIQIVGRDSMKKMNYRFMGKNYPTDVLSFPLVEIPGENITKNNHIGTIVLCNDIISMNAKNNNRSGRDEFVFVLRHGLDHLIGIHHN